MQSHQFFEAQECTVLQEKQQTELNNIDNAFLVSSVHKNKQLKSMKNISWLLIVFIATFFSCTNKEIPSEATKDKALISYVNPFIGTGGHGHTYPGATMPFGMMQLSPDTRLDGWDGCSGYHYSDEYIYGFSHTHLSGTGVSDYGDILLMPTNESNWNNGADGKKGYRSHFAHDN